MPCPYIYLLRVLSASAFKIAADPSFGASAAQPSPIF
jgi:hypothetical protein